jgi:hypothetical protein
VSRSDALPTRNSGRWHLVPTVFQRLFPASSHRPRTTRIPTAVCDRSAMDCKPDTKTSLKKPRTAPACQALLFRRHSLASEFTLFNVDARAATHSALALTQISANVLRVTISNLRVGMPGRQI